MDTYSLTIKSHIVFSTLFTIISILILFRSVTGYFKGKVYTGQDRVLSISYLALLYIQLVLGLLLYFVLGDLSAKGSDSASFRFWALEHFVVMMFALFLSQIGWVLIKNSKQDTNKHRNTLFYYGISILLIIGSSLAGVLGR